MVLVQLVRDDCSYSSDSRRYFNGKPLEKFVISHETPIVQEDILPEEIPILTYRIYNNGTLPDFNSTLTEIYNKLN
jgi:hypothetical protein